MTAPPEFVTYHVDYPVSIPLQEVHVLFHLNGGYTKVLFSEFRSWGRAVAMDVPTRLIPPDLRAIGSCFLLGAQRRSLDTYDSADAVRASRDLAYHIEELATV
jgi:hypothetical protein